MIVLRVILIYFFFYLFIYLYLASFLTSKNKIHYALHSLHEEHLQQRHD